MFYIIIVFHKYYLYDYIDYFILHNLGLDYKKLIGVLFQHEVKYRDLIVQLNFNFK